MSDELLTFDLTARQAKAVHAAASLFSSMVADMNPAWATHLEPDGEPPALFSGLMVLEAGLLLEASS